MTKVKIMKNSMDLDRKNMGMNSCENKLMCGNKQI